jgi:hypothetical protein
MDANGISSPAFQQSIAALFNSGNVIPLQADKIASALHLAIAPDLTADTDKPSSTNPLGFIRRTLPKSDIYFVVNTGNQPIQAKISLASSHKFAQQWNPDTGAITPATQTKQPIHLAPYESIIFVLSDDPSTALTPPAPATSIDLTHDWHVDFASIGHSLTEHSLTDWTADSSTLHYSGQATYTRDIQLPEAPQAPIYLVIDGGIASTDGSDGHNPPVARLNPGIHAEFAPPIREAALVTINGVPAGALWHPPYRLDVSSLLHPGTNQIAINVYNTALNAWSALPPHDYGPLKSKYGDRFQMQDLDQVKPISSGILGTIRLTTDPQ